ncbi:hypothetical protein [Streptomyces katrae]|uniref:hypothetical protein n=1 Tax=Streptomyces katrae TaxID=68223 RepID=UPI0004BF9F85|nr:hypothetical protein [Streptomyces katrae]
MRALEDIKNQVRSLTSRRYVEEAIAAYGASAYRSALMSTWIAVAADIIGKIRLLADEGEGAAVSLRDALDKAIASNDVPALQRFETSLIAKAQADLELIGRREAEELTRLYKDRNLCAHPAFVAGGEDLFDPSPELVRAHLTTAVDALLSQPAVTGRKAIERFGLEVASDSFPRNDQRLNDHLRAGYMDRSTKALRANLIKVICKETLKPDLDLRHRWRCTRTARELQKIAPSEFEEQLRGVLDTQQNGLTDAGLLALVSGLCYVPGTWDLLHKGTQARVEELLQTVTPLDLVETHMLFHGPLPRTPVDQMLLNRLGDVTRPGALRKLEAGLPIFLGDDPDRRLIAPLIDLTAKDKGGGSYEAAASVLRFIVHIAAVLTDEDLEQLLAACGENDQIRHGQLAYKQLHALRWAGPQTPRAASAWAKWFGEEDPADSQAAAAQ